jgi:hypothetical protein
VGGPGLGNRLVQRLEGAVQLEGRAVCIRHDALCAEGQPLGVVAEHGIGPGRAGMEGKGTYRAAGAPAGSEGRGLPARLRIVPVRV